MRQEKLVADMAQGIAAGPQPEGKGAWLRIDKLIEDIGRLYEKLEWSKRQDQFTEQQGKLLEQYGMVRGYVRPAQQADRRYQRLARRHSKAAGTDGAG